MDEVFRGRPFLNSVLLDLNGQLNEIWDSAHRHSIRELKGTNVASPAYRGVLYVDYGDPIETPEHLKAGFGAENLEEVRNALQKLFKNAGSAGRSAEKLCFLKYLLV